ncbi:hypothetical protein Taro_012498, partial [Colocasia esculenta]|nr:hypothetical protein [Colocasia esculenta]
VCPLPQNSLKPPAISRFTPNPPRAPTGIAPRHDQRHAFYDRPTTLQYLLEALGTLGQEAGARENENQVGVNPSAANDNRHTKRPNLVPPSS